MNILLEDLPSMIEIDGIEYRINPDFRSCLRIILAFEDNELAAYEKQAVLLSNLYMDRPVDAEKAFTQGVKFLNGGHNEETEEAAVRLFSFEKDAALIFSAFKQTHDVDLDTTQSMHWWKFLALFSDLGSETTFCSLVGLRKRVKTGKASKDEREIARAMGSSFDIPDYQSPEDMAKEAEFMRQLAEKG